MIAGMISKEMWEEPSVNVISKLLNFLKFIFIKFEHNDIIKYN